MIHERAIGVVKRACASSAMESRAAKSGRRAYGAGMIAVGNTRICKATVPRNAG